MSFTLKPHEWQRTKKGTAVLVRSNPYIRLRQGDDAPIYAQGGKFYTDNGEVIEKVPPWVFQQMKTLTSEVKKEAGFGNDSKDNVS